MGETIDAKSTFETRRILSPNRDNFEDPQSFYLHDLASRMIKTKIETGEVDRAPLREFMRQDPKNQALIIGIIDKYEQLKEEK